MVSTLGSSAVLKVRRADLWLVSNLPSLEGKPFRLPLDAGIAFRDSTGPGEPEHHRPLIGMRLLRRARVKMYLDFDNGTFSLWIPGPLHQTVSIAARRVLSGFKTLPIRW